MKLNHGNHVCVTGKSVDDELLDSINKYWDLFRDPSRYTRLNKSIMDSLITFAYRGGTIRRKVNPN